MKHSAVVQFYYNNSSCCRLFIEETDGWITRIDFTDKRPQLSEPQSEDCGKVIRKTIRQLEEYFAGKRKKFDLPVSPVGTVFQQKVWNELTKIPHGETVSYGQIAANIGSPKASRAVGSANHNNPVSIVIPCHRVIGANGQLTGYGGGLEMKKILLDLEQNCSTAEKH